jgi:hypothetical protein
MQAHQQPQTRPDSPADNNYSYHSTLKSSAHSADSLFSHHPQQHSNQNMYNTIHIPPDYSTDNDGQKPQSGKLNGFGAVGPYRTSASFNAFPNSNRPRHHAATLGSGPYRDASSAFSHPYQPATEIFTSGSAHLTSSSQAQTQTSSAHLFDSLHQARGFNLSGNTQPSNGDRKQSYAMVDFAGGPPAALLQSHQVNGGKPAGGPLSHHSQHSGYIHSSQVPFTNSIHLQSQTPYGPHLQTNGPPTSNGATSVNHVNGVPSANSAQEEISTIFVVGFPEDMQVCNLKRIRYVSCSDCFGYSRNGNSKTCSHSVLDLKPQRSKFPIKSTPPTEMPMVRDLCVLGPTD